MQVSFVRGPYVSLSYYALSYVGLHYNYMQCSLAWLMAL
jgi:hypothetical protein